LKELSKFWSLLKIVGFGSSKNLRKVFFLLIISLFFEMLGIGAVIPVLKVITDKEGVFDNIWIRPVINFFSIVNYSDLVLYSLVFLVFVYLLKSIFGILSGHYLNNFVTSFLTEVSEKLFLGYLNLSYKKFTDRNSSELIRNVQIEVAQITIYIQALLSLISEVTVLIAIILILLFSEPFGTILVLLIIIFFALILSKFSRKNILKWGKLRQSADTLISKYLSEALFAFKEIKIFGNLTFFHQRYTKQLYIKKSLTMKQALVQNLPKYYFELISILCLSCFLYIALERQTSQSDLLIILGIFSISAVRLTPSVNKIIINIQQMNFRAPVVHLLYNEFLSFKQSKEDNLVDNFKVGIEFNREIEFRDISLEFASKNIFNELSLKIKKYDIIGLQGPSGAGKSSLINIFLGLIVPNEGSVLVDGVPIFSKIKAWRNLIGYVPQQVYLLDSSIRHNVAFGVQDDQIDNHKIIQVLRLCQLNEFVVGLKNGIETNVGENGLSISGGQKQRLGIARALYFDPDILVFDEATSALDETIQNELISSIVKISSNKTVIMVAHRLSTLKNCNRIFTLDNGVLFETKM
jgi:ABC-type bacteriocin/lantibiotic exporter with double-glycine peptidase domain